MNSKHRIERVWVDDYRVYAQTEDGLQASYPFVMWKRLHNATKEQRQDFYLTYTGIHWPSIDEDLSFEGMFAHAGLGEHTLTEDSFYYGYNIPSASSLDVVAEKHEE